MKLSAFQYHLPDDRIARYPLADRDQSKLLIYGNGLISHHRFDSLADHLQPESMLVFNDTRVIPARAVLSKPTGARIELLLLHPEFPTRIVSDAMRVTRSCTWECMVGNKKRWKMGEELQTILRINGNEIALTAKWEDRPANLVTLSWDGECLFLDIVTAIGQVPLPPYLGRDAEAADSEHYQTVYAKENGAVAAPTAGLHFTDHILQKLRNKGISSGFVTLHVGAGTFQPIKVEEVVHHDMHSEQIVFTREFIDKLLEHEGPVIAVGTTSLRSLESLYWFGVKCVSGDGVFAIEKDYPYREREEMPSRDEALKAVRGFMESSGQEQLFGDTRIFITPGYRFNMVDGLITNFHQPGSTLILLIAAFTGPDWRKIYDAALTGGYRFLSYGDSSLLWHNKKPLL